VVIIVLTLGATSGKVGLAALAAAAALVVVGIVGALVARQLSGVPENAMKMGVGLMLVSFGTFWSGEASMCRGRSDLAIVALVAIYGAAAWVATTSSSAPGPRRRRRSSMPESASPGIGSLARRALVGFGRFWWDFLIGDTPSCSWGVVVVLVAVGLLTTSHSATPRPSSSCPRPSSSCSRDLAARRSALRSSGRSCQPRAHAAPAGRSGAPSRRRPSAARSRRSTRPGCTRPVPVPLTPQPHRLEEVVDVVGGRAEAAAGAHGAGDRTAVMALHLGTRRRHCLAAEPEQAQQ